MLPLRLPHGTGKQRLPGWPAPLPAVKENEYLFGNFRLYRHGAGAGIYADDLGGEAAYLQRRRGAGEHDLRLPVPDMAGVCAESVPAGDPDRPAHPPAQAK